MFGDIKGYAFLTSSDNVFIGYDGRTDPKGYAEIKNDIVCAPLRIIDIAVDGNGLLLLDNKCRCLLDVRDMKSVKWWFKCDEMNGMLLPPCGDDIFKRMYEYGIRMMRLNGIYDKATRAAVLTNSFLKGVFDDSFLFKQNTKGEKQ